MLARSHAIGRPPIARHTGRAVTGSLHRAIGCILLGLCLAGAGTAIAKQAAAADAHACCPESSDAATRPSPCDGFLPLSCCSAAALPGAEPRMAPPASFAVSLVAALLAPPAVGHAPLAPTPSAPRLPPASLSIVLQI